MQKELLKDIAALTGATVIDNDTETPLNKIELQHFGSAKKIVIDEA